MSRGAVEVKPDVGNNVRDSVLADKDINEHEDTSVNYEKRNYPQHH